MTGSECLDHAGARAEREKQEVTIWSGGYAIKAMYREILATIVAVVAMAVIAQKSTDPTIQSLQVPVIGLLVGGLLLWMLFRRWDVAYRLSDQRLFHEDGILYRRLNRIEVIDIDDLHCEQGLIDRVLGVGCIVISSSDSTHPILVMKGIDRVRDVYEKMDEARRQERMRHGLHVEAI